MSKEVDCRVFEDQLDALVEGSLPEEGLRQLHLHARDCATCALELKVKEHLLRPTLEELEARVPAEMVSSMWPAVRAEVPHRPRAASGSSHGPPPTRTWRRRRGGGEASVRGPSRAWALPTAAAAVAVLLIATGVLFAQLRQVKEDERVLAGQLAEQSRLLAALDSRTGGIVRSGEPPGRTSWIRALSGQKRVSVAQLEGMLRTVPPRAVLLDTSQVEALLDSPSSWTPNGWRTALGALAERESLTAGDLLRLLAKAGLDPQATVATSRLIELLN